MPGELHELSTAIGELRADVRNLVRAHDQEREFAGAHRRELRAAVSGLSQSVALLTHELGEIKPAVASYRRESAERRGAARVSRLIYGGLLAAGSAVGAGLVEGARLLFPR